MIRHNLSGGYVSIFFQGPIAFVKAVLNFIAAFYFDFRSSKCDSFSFHANVSVT